MRKLSVVACALLMALGLSAGHAWSQEIVAIQVSPHVLNLDSQGTCVTVHATIPLSAVAAATVTLNGEVVPALIKSDSRGDLVAKFKIGDVKDIVDPPPSSATLTLAGLSKTGETFSGFDTIRVIDCKSK